MEELASTIDVSRPTLSKFFQDPESVRPSTRERIEEGMETVDYIPNFFATKMNRKSTGLIGVIVPYLNDLFYTALIQAIEKSALSAEFMVIIQSSHGDPVQEAQAFRNLLSMSADGVIVAPIGQATSQSALQRLKDEVPVVFVDSRFPGAFEDVDFVGTNNRQSISLIVDYLHQTGDSPIFFNMPRMNTNSVEREQAYAKRAKELGFNPQFIPDAKALPGWDFEEYAFETMDQHFSRGEFVDSTILCANDRLAIGAIRAANRHQLLVNGDKGPSRCRIAGHDDHPLSAFVYPELTTVSRNTQQIGDAAVEQIVELIETGKRKGKGVTRLIDAELRVRESA